MYSIMRDYVEISVDLQEVLHSLVGCELLVFPSAFNMTTGPAHWELLTRARAADNQMYVAMVSPARDETASYVAWGYSSLADPWWVHTTTLVVKFDQWWVHTTTLMVKFDQWWVHTTRLMVSLWPVVSSHNQAHGQSLTSGEFTQPGSWSVSPVVSSHNQAHGQSLTSGEFTQPGSWSVSWPVVSSHNQAMVSLWPVVSSHNQAHGQSLTSGKFTQLGSWSVSDQWWVHTTRLMVSLWPVVSSHN